MFYVYVKQEVYLVLHFENKTFLSYVISKCL